MEWEIILKRATPWNELTKVEDWAFQEVSREKNRRILILSEPLPTYTCGQNTSDEELHQTKQRLESPETTVIRAPRGGKWTYHGPGQLLVFPVLHLPTYGFQRLGVRAFMDQFRSAAQTGLKQLGVVTSPREEPFGLYVEEEKIASFGLAFRNGISTHGMAVYVTPQQEKFRSIHPCGVVDGKTTSVCEHVLFTTWEDLAENITDSVKNGLISA